MVKAATVAAAAPIVTVNSRAISGSRVSVTRILAALAKAAKASRPIARIGGRGGTAGDAACSFDALGMVVDRAMVRAFQLYPITATVDRVLATGMPGTSP